MNYYLNIKCKQSLCYSLLNMIVRLLGCINTNFLHAVLGFLEPNFCPPCEWQPEWHPTFVLLINGNPNETQLLSSLWIATQVKSNFCSPYEWQPYKKGKPPSSQRGFKFLKRRGATYWNCTASMLMKVIILFSNYRSGCHFWKQPHRRYWRYRCKY